jgi:hypothetical protein
MPDPLAAWYHKLNGYTHYATCRVNLQVRRRFHGARIGRPISKKAVGDMTSAGPLF